MGWWQCILKTQLSSVLMYICIWLNNNVRNIFISRASLYICTHFRTPVHSHTMFGWLGAYTDSGGCTEVYLNNMSSSLENRTPSLYLYRPRTYKCTLKNLVQPRRFTLLSGEEDYKIRCITYGNAMYLCIWLNKKKKCKTNFFPLLVKVYIYTHTHVRCTQLHHGGWPGYIYWQCQVYWRIP